jgi:hypothetical protein
VALPPGREAMPVSTIKPDLNPRMAKAAGELNAWIDYLLHPDTHDGPRIYRPLHPETAPDNRDFESPRRMPPADRDAPYEDPREYQTVSVFEEFAGDTAQFFRAAEAVCGIDTLVMEPVYIKLTEGCLTWHHEGERSMPKEEATDNDKQQTPSTPPQDVPYKELTDTRINWVGMRKSWVAHEDVYANAYEADFLDYQLITENCLYTVAEHIVRYRAILHKAGEDIAVLMEAFTALCPKPAPEGQGSFNLMSVIVTGLVAVGTTVITAGTGGVTAPVLLGVAFMEMVGEGIKTAERKPPEKKLALDNVYYLRDVAKQYLREVEQIEREAATAIQDLYRSLQTQLSQLREARQHDQMPQTGVTGEVPIFDNYLKQ